MLQVTAALLCDGDPLSKHIASRSGSLYYRRSTELKLNAAASPKWTWPKKGIAVMHPILRAACGGTFETPAMCWKWCFRTLLRLRPWSLASHQHVIRGREQYHLLDATRWVRQFVCFDVKLYSARTAMTHLRNRDSVGNGVSKC